MQDKNFEDFLEKKKDEAFKVTILLKVEVDFGEEEKEIFYVRD